jgi:hypothetical protein
MQYGKNGLNDAALQASQIHVSIQVLVFGKRLYYNETWPYSPIWFNKLCENLLYQLGLNLAVALAR